MVYSEIENLARALPISEKMRLAQVLMSDAAWSQVQPLELSEYPKSAEIWSPFDELDAAKDMERHLDNATFELEEAQLIKLTEKSAKRWTGKISDLKMFTDASRLPDV